MKLPKRSSGLTLFELLVAMSVSIIILAVTHAIFTRTNQTWRRISGDQGAGNQLQKAESWLRRDLGLAAYEATRVGPGPSSLTGRDGDALWFLSAIDPATGEFVRNADGTPRWQRNILYYTVIPNDLDNAEFLGAGINVNGYESSYPYKLLVRKQIDFNAPTPAADPNAVEELITNIVPFLERPQGLSFPSGDAEEVTLCANHLLSFQAVANPSLRSVRVILQAAALEEARKEFAIGSQSLLDPRFLLERRMEIFPENRIAGPP